MSENATASCLCVMKPTSALLTLAFLSIRVLMLLVSFSSSHILTSAVLLKVSFFFFLYWGKREQMQSRSSQSPWMCGLLWKSLPKEWARTQNKNKCARSEFKVFLLPKMSVALQTKAALYNHLLNSSLGSERIPCLPAACGSALAAALPSLFFSVFCLSTTPMLLSPQLLRFKLRILFFQWKNSREGRCLPAAVAGRIPTQLLKKVTTHLRHKKPSRVLSAEVIKTPRIALRAWKQEVVSSERRCFQTSCPSGAAGANPWFTCCKWSPVSCSSTLTPAFVNAQLCSCHARLCPFSLFICYSLPINNMLVCTGTRRHLFTGCKLLCFCGFVVTNSILLTRFWFFWPVYQISGRLELNAFTCSDFWDGFKHSHSPPTTFQVLKMCIPGVAVIQ